MNAYAGGTNRAERSALMPPQPNDILTPEGEPNFMPTGFSHCWQRQWKVFLILNIGEHTIRFGSLKLCLTGGIPCDPDEISSRAGAGWLCTENRVSRSAFTHGILSHPHGAQPSADSAGIGGMGRAIAASFCFISAGNRRGCRQKGRHMNTKEFSLMQKLIDYASSSNLDHTSGILAYYLLLNYSKLEKLTLKSLQRNVLYPFPLSGGSAGSLVTIIFPIW